MEITKYLVETCQVDLEAILDSDKEVDDDEEAEVDDEETDVDTKATPLLKACQSGNLDIIQYLVSCGAKMDAKDKDGDSVLHLPVNRMDIVQYFVERHGMDVEQPNLKGSTVLHYACRRGCDETVRCLVQTCNANVNAVNSNGETPLHMASRKGCLEAVQCIVESGRCTKINAQDNDGQTPLHIACANHDIRFAMTRYWLDTVRADVSVRDKDGNTPLHIAAAKGRYGRRTVLFLVTRMSVEDF